MIASAHRLLWSRWAGAPAAVTPSRVVHLAYVFSALMLMVFVARNVSRVPIHDEYSSVIYLYADPPLPLSRYWDQHNEHRIPLPRLLYSAAVRLAGNDFRAPPFLNVALLIGATGFLLRAVRRLRGGMAYTDAAIPLGLLTVGQYGNLLWGFQVQFITSTALVIVALGLAIDPDLPRSWRRLTGLGLCGVLATLCGSNGVVFAPGIAAGLLFVGVRNLLPGNPNRIAGTVALVWGAAVLVVVAAYFHGLEAMTHHERGRAGVVPTLIGAVNLLGASFGPVVRWLQPHPYNGVTVLGIVAVSLVLATTGLLLRAAFDPLRRSQAIVLGGVLVGFLGLAVGIARSRAGFSNVLDANRYVSLMLPMMAGIFAVWTAFGAVRVPQAVAALVVLASVPNLLIGWQEARPYTYHARQIEFEIKAGLPLEFVADRNPALYRTEAKYRRDFLTLLKARAGEPFRSLAPLPPLREERVPIPVMSSEDVIASGADFQVTASVGHVVLALPRRQFVYGLKLTYEAMAGEVDGLPNVLSWELGGGRPVSPGCGVTNQLEPTTHPCETLLYVGREADSLRIDLFGKGSRLTIRGLTVLTRPD